MADMDLRRAFDTLISKLNAAIFNAKIYFQDHPEVSRHIETLHEEIETLLKIKPSLTFIIVDDELVESGKPLRMESTVSKQLIAILKEKGIEHLTFHRGLSKNEIANLVIALAGKGSAPIKSTSFLKLGKIVTQEGEGGGGGEGEGEEGGGPEPFSNSDKPHIERMGAFLNIEKSMGSVKEVYVNFKQKKGGHALMLGDIVSTFVNVFKKGHNPINLLAMIRNSDEYTFTHVVNVCILTMSQAESLGFEGERLYQIGVASMLHDVGKLFIPEEIIKKPGALTKEERTIIDGHVVKGALFVMGMKDVPKLAVLGALEHHIKYNGGGYPHIKGNYKPNVASQMIAIADAYDAMRSKRPYQEPKQEELIITILRDERGKSYDPFLVDNFIRLLMI